MKSLVKDAVNRLEENGANRRRIVALSEQLDDLIDDDEFWRFQARSLAIFATPDNIKTFRVPNALEPLVVVSDRFHLKPLLRAVTFPNVAYVLALAEGSVRFVGVFAVFRAVACRIRSSPMISMTAVDRLMQLGEQRGGLQIDDDRQALPVDPMTTEELADVLVRLEEAGITVEIEPALLTPRHKNDAAQCRTCKRALATQQADDEDRLSTLTSSIKAARENSDRTSRPTLTFTKKIFVVVTALILFLLTLGVRRFGSRKTPSMVGHGITLEQLSRGRAAAPSKSGQFFCFPA